MRVFPETGIFSVILVNEQDLMGKKEGKWVDRVT